MALGLPLIFGHFGPKESVVMKKIAMQVLAVLSLAAVLGGVTLTQSACPAPAEGEGEGE